MTQTKDRSYKSRYLLTGRPMVGLSRCFWIRGRTVTSISADVISALSLLPVGRRATITTTGHGSVRTFLVDIAIRCDDTIWRRADLLVGEFLYRKPSIRGITGRDILCLGDFTMRADQLTLTFR